MSITINGGPGQQVKIPLLNDLANEALTVFNLAKELSSDYNKPLSDVPDLLKVDIQYDSGNQAWGIGGVGFNLSGGVAGHIQVSKSGKLYDYTDSFPTVMGPDLSAQDNSASSATSFPVDDGAIYVGVELDFSIGAGVSFTSAVTSFGLSASASASSSATFTVAFYKRCAPTDIFLDAIGQAFKDLVLPFHSETLKHLQVGDVLRHTAGANLNLGLGAGIGFGTFSAAQQWTRGIKNLPNSPTLSVGIQPTATASATLAYSFSYAGTFEQTLWKKSDQSVQLHLYKSTNKTHTLAFAAGITANVNVSAAIAVKDQILKAPQNATSNPEVQKALNTAFNAASTEISKLADDVNAKITNLLSKPNQDLTIELDAQISSTDQRFLLTDYTIDLTRDFAAAWKKMANGDFVAALADPGGAVQLAVGSGLEKLYSRTTSISLNFFGQAALQWTSSAIENSSLLYAGNNTFHLVTQDGIQQRSLIGEASSEVDFYFSVDLNVSGSGAAASAEPKLNAALKATNNVKFGTRLAKAFVALTNNLKDSASFNLEKLILDSVNAGRNTQILHMVIPEGAYNNLTFSEAGSPADQADRKNYAAFKAASRQTLDGMTNRFVFKNIDIDYELWAAWNKAATGELHANRKKGTNPPAAYPLLNTTFRGVDDATKFSLSVTLQAACEFMNLCEDLKLLCGAEVTIAAWEDFAKRLVNIAKKDLDLDFIVPAVLAISQLLSSGMPQLTQGPAPGTSDDTSIAVTLTFQGSATTAPALEK